MMGEVDHLPDLRHLAEEPERLSAATVEGMSTWL
jgi:hypothetical protein